MSHYEDFDFQRSVIMEKADGSLIGIYSHNGKWHVSTRGTAFAEGEHVMGGTFRDKVLEAFGFDSEGFQDFFRLYPPGITFVFEYISPENRIVTRYEEPKMVLLSVNDGETEYPYDTLATDLELLGLNFRRVQTYSASDMDSVVKLANSLPNLEEGFVIYDPVSNKRMKVKSSLYVVAHSIRGNDPLPTKKNLLHLLFTGELGEFCAYFPEWQEKALDIQREVDNAYRELTIAWDKYKELESQKDFALAIKDVPYNGILFQARKLNKTVNESWNDWPLEKKISMFEKE